MARSKKSKKEDNDSVEVDDQEIDKNVSDKQIEQKTSKKSTSKKPSDKKTSTKKSSSKSSKKDEDEDSLSDIDVDVEGDAQDEVVSTKPAQPEYKIIDPKSRLCDLKPDAILSYLIKLGTDELNPQLKIGSLNLLKQLTGRRRRHPPMYGGGGSKRGGGYNNNYYNQNQRPFDPRNNSGRGRQVYNNKQNKQNTGDIYEDE